ETEELHGAQVHARVEPQPALERPQRAVELHAETAVDVHLALIVLPRNAEDDLPFRFAEPLDDLGLGVVRVLAQHHAHAFEDLAYGLVELDLTGVASHDL